MEFFNERGNAFSEEKYNAAISHFCQSLCPIDLVIKFFFFGIVFDTGMYGKSQDCRKIVHKNVCMEILEYGFNAFSGKIFNFNTAF